VADPAKISAPAALATVALRDVRKIYGAGELAVHALDGVDLEIAAGELVVVLGPSGSGKTTLLNVIGAIEPATSGQTIVAGQDLDGLDEEGRTAFRRASLGFVFQFFNLIPTLTALENVELIAELGGRDGAANAATLLAEVGLAGRVDHFPAQLSGGEQQRVAVARALAGDPGLLLCDEPTGALDLETGRVVLALLREVNRASGRTMVLVTHNAAIARMADRVLRMRSGRVVEDARNPTPVPADGLEW
jgi:putative ABC transport system ATP-binding protein